MILNSTPPTFEMPAKMDASFTSNTTREYDESSNNFAFDGNFLAKTFSSYRYDCINRSDHLIAGQR